MKETIIEHISTFQYNPGHDNSADGSRDKPENVSVKCAKYNSANQDSCPFIFVWLQAVSYTHLDVYKRQIYAKTK